MSKLRGPVLLALVCTVQSVGFCDSKPLELKWNELAGIIAGHNVELTLADGGSLRGEAVAVREGSLLMDIKGVSSAGSRFQKGSAEIPRASIGLIRVDRTRGSWGRTMGTVVGVLSGLVLGGYAAAHTNSAGAGIPTFLGIASGLSVTGYYAGRGLDRRTTLIRIVP
jgi:hypothetical protein